MTITEPGVYDIPDDIYHADPVPGGSLSSTGARRLLPPSCPALFRHEQLNPPPPKADFDFGHAAHREVLGTGPELVVIDADDWRTKAARSERDEAHAAGAVPLLPPQYDEIQAMAAAIRAHQVASALLSTDGGGKAEQSLFWQDDPSGVWRRARLDWLPESGPGRMIITDYKTCRSADLASLQKAVNTYGWHQQAPWYIDGAKALGLATDVAFLFLCQEKTAPYLITVVELTPVALQIGRELNRDAINLYRRCKQTGTWPAYSDSIELVALPAWVENRYLQETSS